MPTLDLSPAVFLDRDGVVIENRHDYVKSLAEVQFIPGALEALAAFAARTARAGCSYRIVMVTNQSAIGRGLVSRPVVDAINQYVGQQIVAAGGRLDQVYVCPHLPDAGCSCRKPAPGMLLEAAAALAISLPHSVMIGDALTDVLAGYAAGTSAILVSTGLGQVQASALAGAGLGQVRVVADLAAALGDTLDGLLALTARLSKTPPLEGGIGAQASPGILP